MSSDTVILETQPSSGKTAPVIRWQRMTFVGITPGDPPGVTLHAQGQTPTGSVRHFSQTVRVVDDTVLLQLTHLFVGAEIRACIETDWNTPHLAATLKDFCCIEAAEATTGIHMEPTT